jgi:hypothetical protein
MLRMSKRGSRDVQDQIIKLQIEERLRRQQEQDPVVFNARGMPGADAGLLKSKLRHAGPGEVGDIIATHNLEVEVYQQIAKEK